jgi:hypothetical protein
MSAVLRVWWTFFTAAPMQRWLGAFGVALLLLGVAGASLTETQRTSEALAFIGFAGFATFAGYPTIIMTGGLLRALSAPSSHRLYPHLRARLLASVALVVATVVAILLAIVAARPDVFKAFTPGNAAVVVLAVSTATICALFIVTRHWQAAWPVVAGCLAVSFWADGGGPDRVREAGFSMTAVVGALTAMAWIVFAVVYLRAQRIEPIRAMAPGGELRDGAIDAGARLSRAAAGRSVLGAARDRPLAQGLLAAASIGVAAAVGIALLPFLLNGRPAGPPPPPLWPCFAMFGMGVSAERAVRQSRLLWLHAGGGRRETRRMVEGFLARHWLRVVVIVLAFVAVAPLLWPVAPSEVALLAAASVSAALCAGYVVLFALGSAFVSIAGFVTLLLAQFAFLYGFAPTFGALALTALQLAAAAALRLAALRRWRTVDWLKLRPVREQRLL